MARKSGRSPKTAYINTTTAAYSIFASIKNDPTLKPAIAEAVKKRYSDPTIEPKHRNFYVGNLLLNDVYGIPLEGRVLELEKQMDEEVLAPLKIRINRKHGPFEDIKLMATLGDAAMQYVNLPERASSVESSRYISSGL